MMTGLYPHTNGLMGLVGDWDLPDTYPTLAQLLRLQGYSTELFGGRCCSEATAPLTGHRALLFGLQHEKRQADRMGYEQVYHDRGDESFCAEVSAEFIAWLRAQDRAAPPYFACLGFFEVHRDFKTSRYTPDDPAAVHIPAYLPDAPEVREDLADLHGLIVAVDTTMERILDALAASGQADNTLLIFSTDHGIAFPRAKSTLYDPGIATTLILRWPAGSEGGRRHTALLSNIDLLPTILDAAGLAVPAHIQGRSFLSLLQGATYQPRTEVFAEKTWHDAYDPMRAIRTQHFKYIRNFPGLDGAPPSKRPRLLLPDDIEVSLSRVALANLGDPHLAPRAEEELYDLMRDPDELYNVADHPAYASRRAELSARLARWMAETSDPLLQGPIPLPQEALEHHGSCTDTEARW
jgi:arylsulfatase A-like enzyme